jgi:peptidoglycan/LPS O-acetylase OafA/YrhL
VVGFFVLSGFLITWLLLKEWDRTGTVSLRAFYARRILRIVPAYAVYVLLAAAYYWAKHREMWQDSLIVAALTYTTNYWNAVHPHPVYGHVPTDLSHTWSLSVEEQFYLLWPLLFLFLFRGRRRGMVLGLCAAIAGVCAWRTFAFNGLQMTQAYVYNAFETRFDALAVGCLLAVLAVGGQLDYLGSRAAGSWAFPLITLGAIAASRLGGRGYHYGPGFTVESVLVAILLVQMLLLVRSRCWSWLEHPVLRYLGTLSYPLYLYHNKGLNLGWRLTGLHPVWQLVIGLLASFLLALGSYLLVERPFLALKKRFAGGEPRQADQAGRNTSATGSTPVGVRRPLSLRP